MKYDEPVRDLGIYIGVIVRRQRENRGLTQSALALKSGVTQAEISYVERGKRAHLKTLDNIAQAMDMRFSDMVRFAEDIGDTKTVVRQAREFVKESRKRLEQKSSAKARPKSARLAASR